MTQLDSTTDSQADWTELRRESLRIALERHMDGEVRFDQATRAVYSTDASIYQMEPMGVVVPRTIDGLTTAVAIAMEQHCPIVPRGGGTSLSGQAIGRGLVIDVSKYLSRVVDLDLTRQTVRVQPGCVVGELNRRLKPLGLMFGPDVATIDRANIGGMIGNNSAGARSVRYGKMVDHVLGVDVVLADGRQVHLGPSGDSTKGEHQAGDARVAELQRDVGRIVREHADEIKARFPKVFRRVSGYNLDALLPPNDLNLSRLIVGSEGTLAVVAQADLSVVPLPKGRGIAVLEFSSVAQALSMVVPILSTKPSAIELIDEMVLELARGNAGYREELRFLDGIPKAILIVEYLEDGMDAVEARGRELRDLCAPGDLDHQSWYTDPEECERIWSVRRMALPLLLSLPGTRKPTTFVEDTAVSPERLGEFVGRFREILHRHGTDGSFYGHASVGCLHIRPLLDLESRAGIQALESIAEEVVQLVLEFGGAMSGEHGDGLARSCFNPILFGDEVYQAFRKVKRVFDPENLMNPGKIVDAPPMVENLRRYVPQPVASSTTFQFSEPKGALSVVQECNGNGLCRRQQKGVMCPSYMATREESDSPRGRAKLLRAALDGQIEASTRDPWLADGLPEALELCLGCKACKSECPSQVDIAKLKSECLSHHHRAHPPSTLDRMVAHLPTLGWWGSRTSPFSNMLMRSWPARKWLYPAMGIDPRRRLPAFRRSTLTDWFKAHRCISRDIAGHVVLLADCFTNFHEPHLGRAAVILLELAGYQVHLADVCCGRTMISKGFLDEAREMVTRGCQRLAYHAEQGHPILGIEPSCILTLNDEWRDLDPAGLSRDIVGKARLLDGWLADRQAAGESRLLPSELEPMEVLVHGHCHQRSAGVLGETVAALEQLAVLRPRVIDSGCCGMAGSFGYEKSHYEVSVNVAEQRLLPAIREAPNVPLVAPGFSCRTQIRDLAGRVAHHPIEMIRRRLGVAPKMR